MQRIEGEPWTQEETFLFRLLFFRKFVMHGKVGHSPTCSPQVPGGVQVLEGWQIVCSHLLSRAN